uniref:UDP-glucose/GDP-mannose dehydrogenase N-terminal domain-containing protein n=1 Tax=Candidatus Methanophagaceae archaeon ANME-1 ERB6 TaxID=2759912 RepID=A0A7G9YU78_9EURY|nr:hypothetical protein FJOHDBIG_00010 [Methanosarcinales archaeon ANME-1 ERB6]
MNMNKNVKLSILGSGPVGKAVGKAFARYGFEVIFHDMNRAVLKALASEGYKVSYDLEGAVRRSNISFICMSPTTITGKFDSSEVEEVYSRIIEISKEEYHLIVFKSAVSPKLMERLLARYGYRDNQNYGICLNPEFTGSDSEEDFEKQPVVIGGFDERASETLAALYGELERRSCMNFELFIINSLVAVAACEYILTGYRFDLHLVSCILHLHNFS